MEKNILKLSDFLAQTSDAEKIYQFLNELLTPAEIKDISSRMEIIKMLDQGHTQRNIAAKLHVSLCKITRGSKELKKDPSYLREMIHYLNT